LAQRIVELVEKLRFPDNESIFIDFTGTFMAHHEHDILRAGNKLKISLFVSLVILVAEITGGLLSNSLALLSDAGHVFADIIALGLSWYGVRQSLRPADSRMTFGYHRIGVIVAIVNASVIFMIAAVILYEAYLRFDQPPEVKGTLMTVVAVIGLAANLFVTLWLRKEQKTNINIRSAFWHTLGDTLASVGVIAGGILIMLTGVLWIDPLVSVLISLVILYAAWSIFREALRVILEASPKDVDVMDMIRTLKQIPGVKDVHDVHVWSITPELRAMNGHVLIEDIPTSRAEDIRTQIEQVVRERYRVGHTTIQMECQQCRDGEAFCKLDEISHDEHKII
jgi:cobalt-zinc-cadmium efflux system protein